MLNLKEKKKRLGVSSLQSAASSLHCTGGKASFTYNELRSGHNEGHDHYYRLHMFMSPFHKGTFPSYLSLFLSAPRLDGYQSQFSFSCLDLKNLSIFSNAKKIQNNEIASIQVSLLSYLPILVQYNNSKFRRA